MTGLAVSWGPSVASELRSALAPVAEALASETRGGPDIGLVVGAPSAAEWGRIVMRDRLIVMPADDPVEEPFLSAALERAAVRVHLRGALHGSDSGAPWTVVDLPAPTEPPEARGVGASDTEDALSAWVLDAWASFHPRGCPTAAVAVRVLRAGGVGCVARMLEAWAGGAAVVAVCDRDRPRPTLVASELPAQGVLEAAEAVELLVRAPRFAHALVRRGRQHLEHRMSAAEAAQVIVRALDPTEAPGKAAGD